MAPDLLTIPAAARLLTVSEATVRRLLRTGRLRGLAITPRCHRVDAASLRAYLRCSEISLSALPACPSGKIAPPGAGAYNAAATSLLEALARAKRRLKPKPSPAAR